jgi:hypothetical protein
MHKLSENFPPNILRLDCQPTKHNLVFSADKRRWSVIRNEPSEPEAEGLCATQLQLSDKVQAPFVSTGL